MAHEMTSGGNQTARDGVDTRNKDLTGAGVVKVIPELASNASSAAGGGELEAKKVWSNGQLKYHKKEDGTVEEFDRDGRMLYRELPDGTVEEYKANDVVYRNFQRKYTSSLVYKKLPDGTVETYDGGLNRRDYPDGSYEEYNIDGSLDVRKLSDGSVEHYGTYSHKLVGKYLPDGSWITYKKDGSVLASGNHDPKEGEIADWDEDYFVPPRYDW